MNQMQVFVFLLYLPEVKTRFSSKTWSLSIFCLSIIISRWCPRRKSSVFRINQSSRRENKINSPMDFSIWERRREKNIHFLLFSSLSLSRSNVSLSSYWSLTRHSLLLCHIWLKAISSWCSEKREEVLLPRQTIYIYIFCSSHCFFVHRQFFKHISVELDEEKRRTSWFFFIDSIFKDQWEIKWKNLRSIKILSIN